MAALHCLKSLLTRWCQRISGEPLMASQVCYLVKELYLFTIYSRIVFYNYLSLSFCVLKLLATRPLVKSIRSLTGKNNMINAAHSPRDTIHMVKCGDCCISKIFSVIGNYNRARGTFDQSVCLSVYMSVHRRLFCLYISWWSFSFHICLFLRVSLIAVIQQFKTCLGP